MRRLLACAALAMAATCVLASPATAAPRSLKAIWGPTSLPSGASAFPIYHRLGASVYEVQLPWNLVAAQGRPANPTDPGDPAYRWLPEVDRAVSAARRYHIRLAIMVKGSPTWANGGRDPEWAPTSDADYANFLTAASRRYSSVHIWMVWGEANRTATFQPLPPNSPVGPQRYATLLNAGYHALKRRSGRNIVVGGMTFSFGAVVPRSFLRWMRLPNGQPPPLDWFGHNPFSRRFPNIRIRGYAGFPGTRDIDDVDTFAAEIHRTYRRAYRRFRRHGPRLWLSEFTVSSDHPNRAFDFAVSRPAQARWLTAAYRIACRNPSYIAGLGWFDLVDDPPSPSGLTTGLMTSSLVKKPAYFAYAHARERPSGRRHRC